MAKFMIVLMTIILTTAYVYNEGEKLFLLFSGNVALLACPQLFGKLFEFFSRKVALFP
jgi:hypothetical protein